MNYFYAIIFEDDHIIIANKPAGIPVQPDKTSDQSFMTSIEKGAMQPLFLINRIDRPASGLVLFAKDKGTAAKLSNMLAIGKIEKTYLAVVGQKPDLSKGKLVHHLRKESKSNRSFAFNKPLHHTKKAILEYRVLASIERYHLIEVQLGTGRHHQIRAQFGAIGSPIKGDVKYGFRRGNRDRSIHLHAWKLRFRHPLRNEIIEAEAPIPQDTVWANLT
ncbi:MAG: RluA family pseudouridine synthase [Bacteroidota bacterium]